MALVRLSRYRSGSRCSPGTTGPCCRGSRSPPERLRPAVAGAARARASSRARSGWRLPAEPTPVWETARGAVALDRPVLMGILNVTPDSFSDGGRFAALDAALAQADALLEAGARSSTSAANRPGPGARRRCRRRASSRACVPVVERLVRRHPALLLSVDTVKAEVARAALDAGAAVVNDVSGLRLDPALGRPVARAAGGARPDALAGPILEIASYAHATYADVVGRGAGGAAGGGCPRPAPPGVAPRARSWSTPASASRRRRSRISCCSTSSRRSRPWGVRCWSVRRASDFSAPSPASRSRTRDRATAAACALAWERGARLFRVHDVRGSPATRSRSRRPSEVRSAPRAAAVPHAGLAGPARDPASSRTSSTRSSASSSARARCRSSSGCWC